MIDENTKRVYSEVIEVLNNMEKEYIDMIPIKLIDFFRRNSSSQYKFSINDTQDFNDVVLNAETLNILALINIKYWCKDEKHKNELINKYLLNNKDIPEQKINSYEEIFKNKKVIIEENKLNVVPIVKKEKWYVKIFNKIKKMKFFGTRSKNF